MFLPQTKLVKDCHPVLPDSLGHQDSAEQLTREWARCWPQYANLDAVLLHRLHRPLVYLYYTQLSENKVSHTFLLGKKTGSSVPFSCSE